MIIRVLDTLVVLVVLIIVIINASTSAADAGPGVLAGVGP